MSRRGSMGAPSGWVCTNRRSPTALRRRPIPARTRRPLSRRHGRDENGAMELHVVIAGDKDLSGQLYRQLRDAIRGGRLAADEQLPPSRLLARQLKISRKTVSEVYARLTFEKLLVGRVGIGTFVAPQRAVRSAPAPARQ